jgi:hypothetical protein
MTIYVEYAIFDNLVINAILLWFTLRTVGRRVAWWKILVFVATGSFFACAVPILSAVLLTGFAIGSFTAAVSVLMAVKVAVTVVFLWILRQLIRFLNVRDAAGNFLRDLIITVKGKRFRVKGYLDTGNRLVDPESNTPVVIISMSLYLKMFPISVGHYVDFSTVDRTAKMFVFRPSEFQVRSKRAFTPHNVSLGVSMTAFRDVNKYDALLHANFA